MPRPTKSGVSEAMKEGLAFTASRQFASVTPKWSSMTPSAGSRASPSGPSPRDPSAPATARRPSGSRSSSPGRRRSDRGREGVAVASTRRSSGCRGRDWEWNGYGHSSAWQVPAFRSILKTALGSPSTSDISLSTSFSDAVDARHADRQRVAEEDLRERLADDRVDAPAAASPAARARATSRSRSCGSTSRIDAPLKRGSSNGCTSPGCVAAARDRPRTRALEPLEGDGLAGSAPG